LKIKEFSILLKAVVEWNLDLSEHQTQFKDLFERLIKVYNWIETDSILYNCFIKLVGVVGELGLNKECLMKELNGVPLIKVLLKRCQALSMKIPHSKHNLASINNGIYAIRHCCKLLEVRMTIKNSKIFQVLENIYPQIHKNKKSSWNHVMIIWLNFFESLSYYEDTEFSTGQIALLCRLVRFENASIKLSALKIIRNNTLKSSLGNILLTSNDFFETIDLAMSENVFDENVSLLLQTILCIATKSEQMRSKFKNSSINRKLKDHLNAIKIKHQLNLNESKATPIMNLVEMINEVLYA
jgi:hypothetical protein